MMKELFDNDDELLGLVRKQGLLKPSSDFTSRVMRSVEQARLPISYQPLLSRKAWALIIGGFILAVILCWYFFSGNPSDSRLSFNETFDSVRSYLTGFDLSFRFDANAVLIITLAVLSMGILIMLDLWFSNNRKEDTV